MFLEAAKQYIRKCKWCGNEFDISKDKRPDGKLKNANRQYCSHSHFKMAIRAYHVKWTKEHAEKQLEYNRKRYTPEYFKKEYWRRRMRVINILGGKCAVPSCGIIDLLFLQTHYVPTIKGYGWRHPKHDKWIIDNKKDFILLCANHHQELTITNRIRGYIE